MVTRTGRTAIVMAAAAGTAVVGALAWDQYLRPGVPLAVPDATVAALPQGAYTAQVDETDATEEKATPPEQVAEAAPAEAPPVEAAFTPDAVAFDEVRREPDGMTIIAGRAHPGATVQVLLDGNPIYDTSSDGQGKFAAITMIAPDGQGHVLSLTQVVEGEALASADQIILAPLTPPEVVAEATPEAPAVNQEDDTAEAAALADTANDDVPQQTATQTADATATDVGSLPTQTQEATAPQTAEETPAPAAPQVADAPASTEVPALPETAVDTALAAPVEEPSEGETSVTTPIQTARVETLPQPEPEATVLADTEDARPGAPAPQPAQPQLSGAADQLNVATQAAETKVETQSVAAPAVAAPTAEAQPDTGSPAPKPAAEVAVLRSTQEGVELLNVPRPEALENVALDTISYSDTGDVQLSGRAQSKARHVQVYLNNSSVIQLEVDAAGRWRGDLPDVDEGIYTLRVDEVAEDGRVTSRVETPFKREAPEVLAEAAAREEGPLKQITVQKGATLWAIAQERYGDGLLYVNVFQANAEAIRDPDLIYPGQVFQLPE